SRKRSWRAGVRPSLGILREDFDRLIRQLGSQARACRTALSYVCFGWKADTGLRSAMVEAGDLEPPCCEAMGGGSAWRTVNWNQCRQWVESRPSALHIAFSFPPAATLLNRSFMPDTQT